MSIVYRIVDAAVGWAQLLTDVVRSLRASADALSRIEGKIDKISECVSCLSRRE